MTCARQASDKPASAEASDGEGVKAGTACRHDAFGPHSTVSQGASATSANIARRLHCWRESGPTGPTPAEPLHSSQPQHGQVTLISREAQNQTRHQLVMEKGHLQKSRALAMAGSSWNWAKRETSLVQPAAQCVLGEFRIRRLQ